MSLLEEWMYGLFHKCVHDGDGEACDAAREVLIGIVEGIFERWFVPRPGTGWPEELGQRVGDPASRVADPRMTGLAELGLFERELFRQALFNPLPEGGVPSVLQYIKQEGIALEAAKRTADRFEKAAAAMREEVELLQKHGHC